MARRSLRCGWETDAHLDCHSHLDSVLSFRFLSPVPDAPDPPRKQFGFKERDFKRDNVAAGAEPPPPTAKELAMLAGPVAKHGKALEGAQKADDPNDVYAALQKNRAVEKQHGLDAVEIKKIKSRRKRDYWLLIIVGNLAIAGAVGLAGFNIISAIFGLAGAIMFNLSVTWIMWQIMSKY
ncbi:MAG TPA: hypothetical protein VG734_02960 [Lacunisphaera sp.]|nr:hypothetical protein [Lacunisphaera sp.]